VQHTTTRYDFGYFLIVRQDGTWCLRAGAAATLAQGTLPPPPARTPVGAGVGDGGAGGASADGAAGAWRELTIAAVGQSVACWVDGRLLANVSDAAFATGWAGIGSGFHLAQFANFSLDAARW